MLDFLRVGSLSVLGLLCAGLAACGGSSSETPFPLEPDPRLLKPSPAGSARYVVLTGRSRPVPSAEGLEEESAPAEKPTWGGSKSPKPAAEPESAPEEN